MEDKKYHKTSKNIKKPLISFDRIISYLKKLLNKKYFVSKTLYEKIIIRNIIFDDKNKYVATFKEQLIFNDSSDFMKKYYKLNESKMKLKKYYEFYTKYSKLFPNYIPLYESKYIYKNIHKKQKIIDLQQNEEKNEEKTRNKNENNDNIFSSKVYNSMVNNSALNSTIFGIHKKKVNDINNDSFSKIESLINSIEKYEYDFENEYQQPKNNNKKFHKILKNKNIIINNYYYNNSSVLTKQSIIPWSFALQNKNFYTNEKIFSILGNNILIGLKKNKKKQNYKNKQSNNSSTFKNIISFPLNNTSSEKNNNNKKQKFISEDTYILNNSLKNNKTNSSNKNKSFNYMNNKTIYGNIKINSNISKKQNLIQNHIKEMPYTSRGYLIKNKKINNTITKLNNFNINNIKKKFHQKNNKSSINTYSGNIKIKKRKQINYSNLNKIFLNKTNCISHRTCDYFESLKNNYKKKRHHFSVNFDIKNISNNNSRNESNNSKFKMISKNPNTNVLLRKRIKKIEARKSNRLNILQKKYNFKNLTSMLINSYIKSIGNIQKTMKNKAKMEAFNIKTEREHIYQNKFNEETLKKIIKKKNFIEKIKNNHKNNNTHKDLNNYKFIKKININNINDNKKSINGSNFITNSFFKKENSTFDTNFKLKSKNSKIKDIYKIKKKLFHNKDINKKPILNKYFHSNENSLNFSGGEAVKDYIEKIYTSQKITNSKKSININEKNNTNVINTKNNMKRPSIIRIKGIQIKNFNKILNINKGKCQSNSNKKHRRITYKNSKIIFKIPKYKNNKIANVEKININNNQIKFKIKISNYAGYNFTKSLTERDMNNKSQKTLLI